MINLAIVSCFLSFEAELPMEAVSLGLSNLRSYLPDAYEANSNDHFMSRSTYR